MSTKPLSPTLWRTCRMLAGKTRIRLLRHIEEHPGQSVSERAKALDIGISDASQELRRIQSRGLLQVENRGARVIYRLGADPLVYSAAPILQALRTALSHRHAEADEQIRAIAKGLGHRKRIALIQSLRNSPKNSYALHQDLQIPYGSLHLHLQALLESGLIQRENKICCFIPPVHPLAKAIIHLLPPV
jgi:predicted transcriptional regulator